MLRSLNGRLTGRTLWLTVVAGQIAHRRSAAWAPIAFANDGVDGGWRWTAPRDPYNNHAGIGGGIVYRITPQFCERILPRFHDDLYPGASIFVTCSQVRSAIAKAFMAWSSNHPALHFVPAGENACEGTTNAACMMVEVEILAHHGQNVTYPRFGAYVQHISESQGPTLTTGKTLPRARSISGASIHFNANECWYIDSSWCGRFHSLKSTFGNQRALFLGQVVLGALWTAALVIFLGEVGYACTAVCRILLDSEQEPRLARRRQSSKVAIPRFARRMDLETHATQGLATGARRDIRRGRLSALAFNIVTFYPLALTISHLLLLIFPPVFYITVFLPCWRCFDFNSAAVHEVGHVLGLDHPDRQVSNGATNFQWRPGLQMGPRLCHRPEQFVEAANTTSSSIMLTLTQHTSHGCVRQDDLDGLNFLYPTCSNVVSTAHCDESERNIGWVRLALAVFVPLVVALSAGLCCTVVIKRHHLRRLKGMKQEVRHLVSTLDQATSGHVGTMSISKRLRLLRQSFEAPPSSNAADAPFEGPREMVAGRRTRTEVSEMGCDEEDTPDQDPITSTRRREEELTFHV